MVAGTLVGWSRNRAIRAGHGAVWDARPSRAFTTAPRPAGPAPGRSVARADAAGPAAAMSPSDTRAAHDAHLPLRTGLRACLDRRIPFHPVSEKGGTTPVPPPTDNMVRFGHP